MLVRIFFMFTLVLAVACGAGEEPSGDPQNEAPPDATFALVYQEVITPNCSCHLSGDGAGGLKMPDAAAAHAALVEQPTNPNGPCASNTLVVSGDARASVLYRKIANVDLCGSQMPLGRGALSDAQIELVKTWIGDGAVND